MFDERCPMEPTLDELFGDSTLGLLMQRDGVSENDIRALLSELKDARSVVLDGSRRGPGAAISAARRTEMVVNSPTAKSSKTGQIPLRFI